MWVQVPPPAFFFIVKNNIYKIEPFRIKTVEPIPYINKKERVRIIKNAKYNIFNIPSSKILIDLLTDSGTNAISIYQWAKLMEGDEAYAGAKSFERFIETVKDFTGMPYVLPVHQGRGAERILAEFLSEKVKNGIVPSNTHFDTTRANIEYKGMKAPDLVIPEAKDPEKFHPFKGNMNLEELEEFLKRNHNNVPAVFMTVTNNSLAGQPVSVDIKRVREICDKFNIPLFLDVSRIAENAYFVKMREKGYGKKKVKNIIREIISYGDLAYMSAKKDGIANIGGFIALKNEEIFEKLKMLLILWEGFPTYGGLSGRELEVVAQGLKEVCDESYLEYRIAQTRFLGEELKKRGIPVYEPIGGHAVYVISERVFPHIKKENFPGHTFCIALYIEGGIRTVEIGSLMHGENAHFEFVRYAIPRRVYTETHLRYVAEKSAEILKNNKKWKGVKIIRESPYLRHFTAEFELL